MFSRVKVRIVQQPIAKKKPSWPYVGGLVRELFEFDALRRLSQQLHIGTTALQSTLSLDLIPMKLQEIASKKIKTISVTQYVDPKLL